MHVAAIRGQHACIQVCVCVCVYVSVCLVFACLYMRVCVCVCVCACTQMHVCILKCIGGGKGGLGGPPNFIVLP